jgi:hypothetical protein
MMDNDIKGICGCAFGAFVIAEVYAWIAIYRLWLWYVYRKPLSSVTQVIRVLLWILVASVVGYCTIFLLSAFFEVFSGI